MRLRFDLDAPVRIPTLTYAEGADDDTPGKRPGKGDNLQTYEWVNYIASLAHLSQAAWAFMLDDVAVPVDETYLDWATGDACSANSTAVLNGFVITRSSERTHELSLKWLIVAFHLLSFFFEIIVTDPLVCVCTSRRQSYRRKVRLGVNSLRFIEYSASASIMLIAISLVSGIYDSYALIGIGFLTFVTMALGGVAEQLFSDAIPLREIEEHQSLVDKLTVGRSVLDGTFDPRQAPSPATSRLIPTKPRVNMKVEDFPFTYNSRYLGWICHFTGWFSMLSAYGIILRNFAFANEKSTEEAPWFVYIIVVVIFILYNIFGFIQLTQLWNKTAPTMLTKCKDDINMGNARNTKWNERVELVYVVNSLASKTLLGSLIIFNVIQVDRQTC